MCLVILFMHIIITQHENDAWHTNHFFDSKLGCNSVSWAPHNSVGSRDEHGTDYMRLVSPNIA
jgi:hypothetical protein